ncbi:hypothetical protein BLA29_011796, partial [Euroglyphus maynei]
MAKSRIPVSVKSPAMKHSDHQKSNNKKNKKVTGGDGGDNMPKPKKRNLNQDPIMKEMMSEDSSSNGNGNDNNKQMKMRR